MAIIEPLDLVADDATDELVISWSDGHESHHGFEQLRWLCPCAECRGEWGAPGKLSVTRKLEPIQYRLDNVVPVGRYAVQPIWGDGHNSGLYTYEYLRKNCECAEHTAERKEKEYIDPS